MRAVLFVLGICIVATPSTADERFQWKGQVDGVDEILIRGRSVRVNHLESKPIQRQDYRFSAPLPNRDIEVELRVIEGRGKIRLMEQPSARNDYTAVVRIEDHGNGDSYYELELVWDDEDDDWGWNDDDDGDDWGGDFGREEGVFRWEGRVDKGAEIRIRGNDYRVDDMGGQGTQERRADFDSALPESDVVVSLRKLEGRGDVELIQAPDASNGYTAVVRIEDDKGGADDYEIELRWRR